MLSFLEGTLLISNILLIFFAVIYGLLIVRHRQKAESSTWLAFLVASGLFFLSEAVGVAEELSIFEGGVLKAILRILFGGVILYAFLSKYQALGGPASSEVAEGAAEKSGTEPAKPKP